MRSQEMVEVKEKEKDVVQTKCIWKVEIDSGRHEA